MRDLALALSRRVAPFGHFTHDRPRCDPRVEKREGQTRADRDAPLPVGMTILDKEGFSASGCHANSEPSLFVVKNEDVLLSGWAFESFDPPQRELHSFDLPIGLRTHCGPAKRTRRDAPCGLMSVGIVCFLGGTRRFI